MFFQITQMQTWLFIWLVDTSFQLNSFYIQTQYSLFLTWRLQVITALCIHLKRETWGEMCYKAYGDGEITKPQQKLLQYKQGFKKRI